MKIFAAMYNSCIHESDYGLLSVHLSAEGAEKAVERHKKSLTKKYGKPNVWERHKTVELEVRP